MPTATYQIFHQFMGSSGETWSETFYTVASDALDAATPFAFYRNARLNLLAPVNTWLYGEARRVDGNKEADIYPVNLKGTSFTDDNRPSTVGEALVLQLVGSGGRKRLMWMRGCPNGANAREAFTGLPNRDAKFLAALTQWFQKLQQSGYGTSGIRPVDPAAPLTVPTQIGTVDGSRKDGTSDLTLTIPRAYPAGALLQIGGASRKDLPYLNGRWTILGAAVGSVVKIAYQTPNGSNVQAGNAKIKGIELAGVDVFLANKCRIHHSGTHDTKNTFTRSRGSKRAQRLRHSL